jgi:hypothetical protein
MFYIKKTGGGLNMQQHLSVKLMKYIFTISLLACFHFSKAQKIDSIFFNLYTDN